MVNKDYHKSEHIRPWPFTVRDKFDSSAQIMLVSNTVQLPSLIVNATISVL